MVDSIMQQAGGMPEDPMEQQAQPEPELLPSQQMNQPQELPDGEDKIDKVPEEYEHLFDYMDSDNIAEDLDDGTLREMAEYVLNGYETDCDSRAEWMDMNKDWLDLATQVKEQKNHPWPNASNVKYPLITTAAIQFHARAFPSLVTRQPVHAVVKGRDPDGQKRARADRIGKHMSYQVLHEMENWEEDMDRLLLILPISGLAFKKVYRSYLKDRNESDLKLPTDVVINYYAKNMKEAPRITEVVQLSNNDVFSFVNTGMFLDVIEEDSPVGAESLNKRESHINRSQGMKEPTGDASEHPHEFLECHTFWDLDEDGYEEPYIITVHMGTRKVVRVVARYDENSLFFTDKEELVSIEPIQYYHRFGFIPDPNSAIYALGFGSLLGPTNKAVNTLINQLIDAGTLSNLPSGFLSKGIRMKGGAMRFKPGEWKFINTSGEDLQRGVYPLPTREPSNVLFQLLGLLLESGERLSSVTDMMVGQNPGQNQPSSTSMAVMEQGMKVFTGIFKRVFRSLQKEYKSLYYLNHIYADNETYILLNGEEGNVYHADYDLDATDVFPAADPEGTTDAQKIAKAEQLMALAAQGQVNPEVAKRRYLEALGIENVQELLEMPEPQPDPEVVLSQEQFEHQRELDWANVELEAIKSQAMAMRNEASAMLNIAKAESEPHERSLKIAKQQLDEIRERENMINERLDRLVGMVDKQREAEQPERPQQRPEQTGQMQGGDLGGMLEE